MALSCSICCEPLVGENIGPCCCIPCGHSFHEACLKLWFETDLTCPQCRRNTDSCDTLLLYFNEDPESSENRELEQKLDELSLSTQAERIALQTLTEKIEQLSEQVAYIQENGLTTARKSSEKREELKQKLNELSLSTQAERVALQTLTEKIQENGLITAKRFSELNTWSTLSMNYKMRTVAEVRQSNQKNLFFISSNFTILLGLSLFIIWTHYQQHIEPKPQTHINNLTTPLAYGKSESKCKPPVQCKCEPPPPVQFKCPPPPPVQCKCEPPPPVQCKCEPPPPVQFICAPPPPVQFKCAPPTPVQCKCKLTIPDPIKPTFTVPNVILKLHDFVTTVKWNQKELYFLPNIFY